MMNWRVTIDISGKRYTKTYACAARKHAISYTYSDIQAHDIATGSTIFDRFTIISIERDCNA